MDLNTLKVYNAIHKLGLTSKDYKAVQEELRHKHRSGVWVYKLCGAVAVAVEHGENQKIMIKEYSGIAPARILLNTLITFEPPEEVYALHSLLKKNYSNEFDRTIKTLKTFKNYMIKRINHSELGGDYDDVYQDYAERTKDKPKRKLAIENQLKAIFWLLGGKLQDDYESRINIGKIVKTWQFKNRRVAFIQEKECFDLKKGMFATINVDRVVYYLDGYEPKDKEYNYVCPGREIGIANNSEYETVWLDGFEIDAQDLEALQVVAKRLGKWLITADDFITLRSQIKQVYLQRRRSEELKEAEQRLKEKISKQFDKGVVGRKGFTFSKKRISYDKYWFGGDDLETFIAHENVLDLEEPDFETLFYSYVESVLQIENDTNYWPIYRYSKFYDGCVNFKINGITVRVWRQGNKILTVNKVKIERWDMERVCKESIRFKSQKKYDQFVQSVKELPLRMRHVLDYGSYEFKIDFSDNECDIDGGGMAIGIPVVRDNNCNLIVVGDKKLKIKNINSFFKLGRGGGYNGDNLQYTISQFFKAISKITEDDIAFLIGDGVKKYEAKVKEEKRIENAKIKKSKEFLANAVKLTNAVPIKRGYKVIGDSGTFYTVNSESGAVYKEGKDYLCIVDTCGDSSTKWGMNDKIAQRLLMLSKDKKVASEVYDMGDRMDRWWTEI